MERWEGTKGAKTNLWETEKDMKAPTLRVKKWLGDIPLEAECALCPGTVFKALGSGHRPNKPEYAASLQRQFEDHVRTTHRRQQESVADS